MIRSINISFGDTVIIGCFPFRNGFNALFYNIVLGVFNYDLRKQKNILRIFT